MSARRLKRVTWGGSSRRGVTMIEMVIAGGVTVLLLFALAGFSRFQSLAWLDVNGDYSTADRAKLALQKIAATVREARGVVGASSSASRLTVQMPSYDGTGTLVLPMQNGQVISYYLSDTSGDPSQSGTILWRSVDGVPDRTWSLQRGHGRHVMASGGLTFAYSAAGTPAAVTITLTAQQSGGTAARSFGAGQVVMLRNYGL